MRTSGLALIAILACAPWNLSAQSFVAQSPQFTSARLSAIGGMHAALADDITTLFSNPAGFQSAGPQFSISEASVHLAGPVFSIANLLGRVAGSSNPAAIVTDPSVVALFTNLYASAALNGPISLGYVGNGLGFGFFNSTGVTLSTVGAIPTINAAAQESLMFVGGYSFAIPLPEQSRSTLDLGLSIKLFATGTVRLSQDVLSLISLFSSGGFSSLLNQPLNLDIGVGLDTGVLYSWDKTISAGIVARNLYTPVARSQVPASGAPVTYGTVPIDLSTGVMYSPHPVWLEPYVTGLKIMVDYSDILDFLTHPSTASNPILHVGAGVELTILRILALRAGLDDGYLSAGIGLNLTAFQLDFAMYGSELSLEPGLHPVYNLSLGLEFRY